ncbi:xylulokinase [Nakamurella lactea]|uniref:xylulokinase n=1 Tax=Nakamurella lactea TaxID=459515 RepID=UPI00041ED3BA|nr:xylulokinase [Nakamurella lactea]
MTGSTVVGVDSSTQSCKVLVCDAETGRVLRSGRADHPQTLEAAPGQWWQAFESASDGLLDGASAIAVAAQQHGMVTLDADDRVVRDALLWNDLRSAADTADLIDELGAAEWAAAVGSVPAASFTVTKLRWLARNEPANAARVAQVMLPHDWLTWQLSRSGDPAADAVTDRGDASGTGYFSPATGCYRLDLLERAFGGAPRLPRLADPGEQVGRTSSGALVGPGTGDNMGAALGLGAGPGDVVLSLGTSGTVFGVADEPCADATGYVSGFADATGRFLPLVCTLNAARVLTSTAAMLGTDLAGLDELALRAEPGAGGLTMLPYLDGERTPNLPDATGSLHGLTRAAMTPENLARAAVEGMLCSLADGLDALTATGFRARRLLVIGGASASRAVRASLAELFGLPVALPDPAEYVALGAARQAAWVLAGGRPDALPDWPVAATALPDPSAADLERGQAVRARYAAIRLATYGV